jgi:putative addiction module killer protein
MEDKQWEIQKYVLDSGVCPFDEWFNTLDIQTQTKIDVRFDRISLGNFGDKKSVGQGVYELRFHFGSGYRVYFGIAGKRIILLLLGGIKKSQTKDINTAQKMWNNYQKEQKGRQ